MVQQFSYCISNKGVLLIRKLSTAPCLEEKLHLICALSEISRHYGRRLLQPWDFCSCYYIILLLQMMEVDDCCPRQCHDVLKEVCSAALQKDIHIGALQIVSIGHFLGRLSDFSESLVGPDEACP